MHKTALLTVLLVPLSVPAAPGPLLEVKSGAGRAEHPGEAARAPERRPGAPHRFTYDDMARLARVSQPRLSPDGNLLCYVRTTSDLENNRTLSALFAIRPGAAEARQVTHPQVPSQGGLSEGSPRFSPDGQSLAFVSNRDGSPQLYLMPLSLGEPRRVTSFPGGVSDPEFAPDGRSILVSAMVYPECPPLPAGEECNIRRHEASEKSPVRARVIERLMYRHWDSWFDGRRRHIVRVTLPASGGRATLSDLTPGDADTPPLAMVGARPYVFSPDGREIAWVGNRDRELALSTNSDIFVLPEGAARPINLTQANPAADIAPRYSPDGRYLAYLAQRRPGFESDRFVLWLYDRQARRQRPLTQDLDLSAGEPVWAADSARIYFTTSQKGRGRIYQVAVAGGAPSEVVTAHAEDLQMSADGRRLIFLSSSLSRAPEVHALEVSTDGRAEGKPVPLSHENDATWPTILFGKVDERLITTADGKPLHSFLITPPGFDASRRYPAVVLIHGGPQGAWEDHWHLRWNAQIYAAAGYVVLMVNPRGSSGYGQRFVDEVSGEWGGRAYDDVMRAVDDLVSLPYVDGRRLGALGASYGGYMVNWIAGHTGRFAALVSHAGVYDLRSMQGETEELWFPRWEFGGDPWSSDQYDRWSPSRFAGNIKTPMLVITGELDYRVPFGQGMQLFTALRLRNVPAKMLIFPDENHFVLKPQNARLFYATVLDWLHRYLGGAPADRKALQLARVYAR